MNMVRQQGKSAVLAAGYGAGMQNIAKREHPLQWMSNYTYVNRDKRFGGVPVYKVCTKITSEIMRRELVPHTSLYYRNMDELDGALSSNVIAIAWVRRTKLEDLSTAVATML